MFTTIDTTPSPVHGIGGMSITSSHRPTREWPMLVLALALVGAFTIPLWKYSSSQRDQEARKKHFLRQAVMAQGLAVPIGDGPALPQAVVALEIAAREAPPSETDSAWAKWTRERVSRLL